MTALDMVLSYELNSLLSTYISFKLTPAFRGYNDTIFTGISGIGLDPVSPDPDNQIFATVEDAIDYVINETNLAEVLLDTFNADTESSFTQGTVYGPIYDEWELRPDTIQPRDAALDAISGLTITTYGKGFLALAGASNARTAIGLTTPDNQTSGSVNAVIPLADASKLSALTSNISQFTNDVGYLTSNAVTSVAGRTGTVTVATTDMSDFATATDARITTKINALVNGAPGALDTLKELADAINDDASYAATVTTALGNKVDKVSGKALSTNDYTATEQTKLAGIEAGATKYKVYTVATSGVPAAIADPITALCSGVVSGGVVVFQMTTDGTSTGTALFPSGPLTGGMNIFVNSAVAAYQDAAVWSNSNKTLTITANKLTTSNILTGILGQAAANGDTVTAQIMGH